jgi:hypothetical protein
VTPEEVARIFDVPPCTCAFCIALADEIAAREETP